MSFDFEFTAFLQLLWRATWQASVLALIVYLVTTVLRPQIAPKWRAIMWTLPLARMVLLLIPASTLSLFYFIDFGVNERTPAAGMSLPATIVSRVTTGNVMNQQVGQPVQNEIATENPATVLNSSALPQQKTKTSSAVPVSSLLACIWLIGCCLAICWWAGSKMVLSRMITGSDKLHDERLLQQIELRRRQHHLWFPIRCVISDANLGPSVCGFWRPTILLPRTLCSELSNAELHTIINHEIEHIRRWDVLFLFMSRLASAIHWFNPVVYFIGNRLRREMELAVDAATVSTLDAQARHAYGELLIRLSQRTQRPIAAIQMAGKRSALSTRIDQLATPMKENRTRSIISIGLISLLFVTGLSDVAQTQVQKASEVKKESLPLTRKKSESAPTKTQNQYFITGTVREAGTNQPVADAEIQIFAASQQDPDKKILKGMSDQTGRYRIEVPLGNVQLWFPILKPGYWLLPEDCTRNLITTPEKPIVKHNLEVHTGAVWNIHYKGELNEQQRRFLGLDKNEKQVRLKASVQEIEDDAKRAAWLSGKPVTFQKAYASSYSHLNQEWRGQLTEVGTSGKFIFSIINVTAELIVEPGFDNLHVVTLNRLADSDTTEMIDQSGKKAIISNATVTLNNGVPLLTFQNKASKPLGSQKLMGRVIDVDGNPLSGVRVGVVSGMQGGGSGDTGEATKSKLDGRFEFDIPLFEYNNQSVENQQFSVVLTKDGFAGIDTHSIDVSKEFPPIDFKTLTLRPGYSVPIRVLDKQGKPVPGAIVEPENSYALRRQAVRTSADGRALIKNLPSGVVRASVRWGSQMKQANLVVSKNQNKNKEVTIQLKELATSTPAKLENTKPLAVGQIAPEWDISEWSDGRARQLSDYFGQVVVLNFWSLSPNGAVTSIPAQKRLARQFTDQGVVFIGINTAGSEMSQINKLKETEQWTTPTGIDRGTSQFNGVTFKKYGVDGNLTLIVIDAAGKISFRSDVEPSQDRETYIKNLAEESGISWPPPENATKEQMLGIMNQIQFTLLSREINRVLKAKQ